MQLPLQCEHSPAVTFITLLLPYPHHCVGWFISRISPKPPTGLPQRLDIRWLSAQRRLDDLNDLLDPDKQT